MPFCCRNDVFVFSVIFKRRGIKFRKNIKFGV